jgi:hypothetical protein
MIDQSPSNPRDMPENPGASQGERAGWAVILIFACLALGFAASAAEYERIVATGERHHAELLAAECSIAEGQLEDLGKFLADPHTRFIPLTRSGGFASSAAMIAWNPPDGHGYFFCDDLPVLAGDHQYEVWALHGMDEPLKIGAFDARAGTSVYPLRAMAMTGKMRLEITAGPRSVQNSAVFAGEIE